MTSESKSRVLHENLDTSFVNLWSLLRSLSLRGFIGRVHVELADYSADVYMTGSNTPMVREIDRAAGTETLEQAALHRLVLRARESPGSISVFEGADEAVVVKSASAPEAIIETAAPVATDEPLPEASLEAGPQIDDQPVESGWTVAGSADKTEFDAATVTPSAGSADEDNDSEGTIDWSEVVKASSEVISGVERALIRAGADFAALFRSARLELADDYTFLDPLSNTFAYANSAVTVTHELPPHTYVAGLSEALRRVVERVAAGDRARRVREGVALELALLARKRKEFLRRSGFQAQFDRIAGTKVI